MADNVSINLSEEVVEQVREAARRAGLSVQAYVQQKLGSSLDPEPLAPHERRMRDIDRLNTRLFIEGLDLSEEERWDGPDLSVEDEQRANAEIAKIRELSRQMGRP